MAQNFLNEKGNKQKALAIIREITAIETREVWPAKIRARLNDIFCSHGTDVIPAVNIVGEDVVVSVRGFEKITFTKSKIEGVMKKVESPKAEEPEEDQTKVASSINIPFSEEQRRNELFERVLGQDEEVARELGEMFCWLLDNLEEEQVIRFLKKAQNKGVTGRNLWDLFLSHKLPKGRYGYRSFMYRFLIYL